MKDILCKCCKIIEIHSTRNKSGLCGKCTTKKWCAEHREEVIAYRKQYKDEHQKPCIDCGKFVDRKSTRCLSCATSGKNNGMFGKRGEKSPSFGKKRTINAQPKNCECCGDEFMSVNGRLLCSPECSKKRRAAKEMERLAKLKIKCVDCIKLIDYRSTRCRSCASKYRCRLILQGLRNGPMYGKGYLVMGENNPNWKGDKVSYGALHAWVRRNKHKPSLCERCQKEPPYDLANISGNYLRDVEDYWYLCRRCHMETDRRLSELVKRNKEKK